MSDSQNQQKEKTKSKQSKKSNSQLGTGKSYLGKVSRVRPTFNQVNLILNY